VKAAKNKHRNNVSSWRNESSMAKMAAGISMKTGEMAGESLAKANGGVAKTSARGVRQCRRSKIVSAGSENIIIINCHQLMWHRKRINERKS
jgi:hypothetical protein